MVCIQVFYFIKFYIRFSIPTFSPHLNVHIQVFTSQLLSESSCSATCLIFSNAIAAAALFGKNYFASTLGSSYHFRIVLFWSCTCCSVAPEDTVVGLVCRINYVVSLLLHLVFDHLYLGIVS